MQLNCMKFQEFFILSSKNGLSAFHEKILSIRGENLEISQAISATLKQSHGLQKNHRI